MGSWIATLLKSIAQTWHDIGATYGGGIAKAVLSASMTVIVAIALNCMTLIRHALRG